MGRIIEDIDLKNRPLTVLTGMEVLSYVYMENQDPCITELTCKFNNKRYKFSISRIEVTQEK